MSPGPSLLRTEGTPEARSGERSEGMIFPSERHGAPDERSAEHLGWGARDRQIRYRETSRPGVESPYRSLRAVRRSSRDDARSPARDAAKIRSAIPPRAQERLVVEIESSRVPAAAHR